MGMAIGVVVDQNIQEEINAAADRASFDLRSLIEAALMTRWQEQVTPWKSIEINITGYGMTYLPGEPEQTTPEIYMIVNIDNNYNRTLRYPNNFPKLEKPVATLNDVRSDGEVTIQLFEEALKILVDAM